MRTGSWEKALSVINYRLPLLAEQALELNLVDGVFGSSYASFLEELHGRLTAFLDSKEGRLFLEQKRKERSGGAWREKLKRAREHELERMRVSFYGFDTSYHVARYYFVHRVPPYRTPPYLAKHRRLRPP